MILSKFLAEQKKNLFWKSDVDHTAEVPEVPDYHRPKLD